MRPRKRLLILDAALRVVAGDGVTAVTYGSVAEEAGLTKGGLVYHLPSREPLAAELQQHLLVLEAATRTAPSDNHSLDELDDRATQAMNVLPESDRAEAMATWAEIDDRVRRS